MTRAALLVALFLTSLPAPSIAQDKARPRRAPALVRAATGSVGRVNAVIRADPLLRPTIRQVVRDRARTIESVQSRRNGSIGRNAGRNLRDQELRDRRVWVPLATDRMARRVIVRTIVDQLARSSRQLYDGLATSPNDRELSVYDSIVVGGGVHASIVATETLRESPDHRMLVLEASDALSDNFGFAGDSFALNSRNDAESADEAEPGFGNLNALDGPIQVTDLSGARWPSARHLAEAVTINTFASGARIGLGARVTGVRALPAGGPARYEVTFTDANRRALRVYSNNVVIASGAGSPRVAIGDTTTQSFVNAQLARVSFQPGAAVPRVISSQQLLRLAALTPNVRDLLRADVDGREPRTAIIGFGDSGKVVAELAFGLAPEEAYDGEGRLDRSQRGEVGPVDWIVGRDGPETCEEFLNGATRPPVAPATTPTKIPGARSRYSPLSSPIRAERLNLVRAEVVAIRPQGGTAQDPQRVEIVIQRADRTQATIVVDRVILAAGLTPPSPTALLAAFGAVTPVALQVGRSAVAKQIPGQGIYFVGPAAGDGIVTERELRRVSENRAALFLLGPRSRTFAREILARTAVAGGSSTYAVEPVTRTDLAVDAAATVTPARVTPVVEAAPTPAPPPPAAPARPAVRTSLGVPARPAPAPAPTAATPPLPRLPPLEVGPGLPLTLKGRMADVLDRFRFRGVERLRVTFARDAEGNLMLAAPGLAQASVDALAAAVAESGDLARLLGQVLESTNDELSFRVSLRMAREGSRGAERGGTIAIETLRIEGL